METFKYCNYTFIPYRRITGTEKGSLGKYINYRDYLLNSAVYDYDKSPFYEYPDINNNEKRTDLFFCLDNHRIYFSTKQALFKWDKPADIYTAQHWYRKEIHDFDLLHTDMYMHAPNREPTALSPDDWKYIHEDEFAEKFGDWEKAWRIQKFINSSPLVFNGEIFAGGENIAAELELLFSKNNKKTIDGEVIREIKEKAKSGIYTNDDKNENILLRAEQYKKITEHDTGFREHIEAVSLIPSFIENGIFIDELPNENTAAKPMTLSYQYFLNYLNIRGEEYTVKSVVAVKLDGFCYYDHKLSTIKKGCLISNFAGIYPPREAKKTSFTIDDKRLIEICQCPQARFLDANFEPRRDVIEKVRAGMTLERLTAQDMYHPDIRMIPRHFDFSRQENNSQHILPSCSGRSRDE